MGWDGDLVDRWGEVDRDSANTAQVNEAEITDKFLSPSNIDDLKALVLADEAGGGGTGDGEPSFPMIALSNTSTTGVNIGSTVGLGTVISFSAHPIYNTVDYLHSTTTNTSRIGVVKDGMFMLKGLIGIEAAIAGIVDYYGLVTVAVNGLSVESTSQGYVYWEHEGGTMKVSATLTLSAGDYIEVYVKRLSDSDDACYIPSKTKLNVSKISPSKVYTFPQAPTTFLTSASSSGYTVSSSIDDGTNYPWHAFDGTKTGMWYAGLDSDFAVTDKFPAYPPLQWIMIECPSAIFLGYCNFYNDVSANIGVKQVAIMGSNDDSTWSILGGTYVLPASIPDSDNTVPYQIVCDADASSYKYICFLVFEGSTAGAAGFSEIEMYTF